MTKSKVSGDMLFKVCILDDCKSDTIGPTSEKFHPHSATTLSRGSEGCHRWKMAGLWTADERVVEELIWPAITDDGESGFTEPSFIEK